MDLNTRIQKIIEYSQLTSSEFADEIGVQRSSISHIISGRNKPSLDFIIKIKERFPEIQWEWIIEGKGNMILSEIPSDIIDFTEIQESKINNEKEESSTPFPDLFSSITKEPEEENILSKGEITTSNPPESSIIVPNEKNTEIEDSQPLEIKEILTDTEITDNQSNKVKKIVFFYENGKFEIFEP